MDQKPQDKHSPKRSGKVGPYTLPHGFKVSVGSFIGSTLIRTAAMMVRLRAQSPSDAELLRPRIAGSTTGGGILLAMWHGDHFPILWAYRGRGTYVITSRSGDGQILTNVLNGLGYRTVRGSSSRGGVRALVDLARLVRQGNDAAIAVDGPRGPRRQVKPGIILLGKLTGSPVIPLAAAMARYKEFHSWDRFRLPWPFTKALVFGGRPVYVPANADDAMIESKRQELERNLMEIQNLAEQCVAGTKSPGELYRKVMVRSN